MDTRGAVLCHAASLLEEDAAREWEIRRLWITPGKSPTIEKYYLTFRVEKRYKTHPHDVFRLSRKHLFVAPRKLFAIMAAVAPGLS